MKSLGLEIVISDDANPEHRAAILNYIGRLEERQLPPILNGEHLSQLLGVQEKILYAISNSPDHFYRSFFVRKKNGGKRQISAPLPLLLSVQRWILKNILQSISVHPSSKAYKKGASIKENARFHRAQECLFKSDVDNFFRSISDFWVYEFFQSVGYTNSVSRLLAGICCRDGALPQGAATSGYLSNIYMYHFDEAAFAYCRERKFRYTRYSDDIAISGSNIEFEAVKADIASLLNEQKLRINLNKTRVFRNNTRQKITGVVVNERLGPDREFLRRIRQDVYYIEKYGIYGHARQRGFNSPLSCLNNLIGRISHARFLLGKNTFLEEAKKRLERTLGQIG